jgi:hypothetical protein
MKTVQLTATQVELAARMGISPAQYAQHLMNLPAEEAVDDEYDDPNKDDVMNIPVKTMRDLWLTKFGYRWVSGNELDDESMDDWSRIESRLQQYNMIETYDDWYKLKEEL